MEQKKYIYSNTKLIKENKMFNMFKNRKKGFTLLELLVVVLIIGILASIALPQYQMAVGRSKFSTLKDNAHAIQSAMDRYYLIHDVFTNNLVDLDIHFSGKETQPYYIDLTDGSACSIGSTTILCNRSIFKIKTEYGVQYTNFSRQSSCIVYSKNLTDKSNRLCQQETGKKTPTRESSSYNVYRY